MAPIADRGSTDAIFKRQEKVATMRINYAELTNKWLRRGTHRNTKELEASITHWIDT